MPSLSFKSIHDVFDSRRSSWRNIVIGPNKDGLCLPQHSSQAQAPWTLHEVCSRVQSLCCWGACIRKPHRQLTVWYHTAGLSKGGKWTPNQPQERSKTNSQVLFSWLWFHVINISIICFWEMKTHIFSENSHHKLLLSVFIPFLVLCRVHYLNFFFFFEWHIDYNDFCFSGHSPRGCGFWKETYFTCLK